ncbi:MAG: hypothetical protein NVSMB14_11430 [Isosphaeraceae bacterium]
MASVRLRTIGMSYIVEGLNAQGLDGDRLGRELLTRYGPAAAVIGGKSEPPTDIAALLIDRRCESWDAFRNWLEVRIQEQGFGSTRWEEVDFGRTAALHFESDS